MREWLRETHGVQFELLHHFLRRLFDSEMITSPEQTRSALIGAISLLLPWFQVLYGPLKSKYAYLSGLPVPGPYREAVRADELWLITLMMSIIGLLTAVKWQSLFPNLRDYRALGALPLRHRQIFAAKLLALLMVAMAALIAVNAFPSAAFPALSNGPWAFHPKVGSRSLAYALASLSAGAFFFFGLIALQGVLLNLLRPRWFRIITGYLQGFLAGSMVALAVLSFSIRPSIANLVIQPFWSRWLPPVWFLGLCQSLSGDPDPTMRALASHALDALFVVSLLTLITYAVSYRRHRMLLLEDTSTLPPCRAEGLLHFLLPDPRKLGVVGFMTKTLARSNHHRMILMGYGAAAFAMVISGLAGMGSFIVGDRQAIASFLYFHIIATIFLVIGARHLFSLPIELKANWVFQITEREACGEWLGAVDRFVLFCAASLWVVPLPIEIQWLGWRGAAEAALSITLALVAYNWWFTAWEKLPFTCSHLPGKSPGWILALRFFALVAFVPALQAFLLTTLFNRLAYLVVLPAGIAAAMRLHAIRKEGWLETRLKFEDILEPAVQGLDLLR